MSTILYAKLTSARQARELRSAADPDKPEVKIYVDILSALVPLEALTLHTAVMALTTKAVKVGEKTAVEITEHAILRVSFGLLVILAAGVYLFARWLFLKGKNQRLDKWDVLRMLVPALAFVGWTFLQRPTAFDGFYDKDLLTEENFSLATRSIIALFLAAVLVMVAGWLKYKRDGSEG